MSIDMATGTRAFCTTCGTALENGACPTRHDGSSPRPAEPSLKVGGPARSSVGRVVGAVAVGAIAAGLVVALILNAAISAQVTSLRRRVGTLERSQRAGAAAATTLGHRVNAINGAANGLAARVGALEAKAKAAPNPAAIAKKVKASVFVIETDVALGSAWAVSSAGGSSTLVTNFHVIADTWNTGGRTVHVKQNDATWTGSIVRVDIPDDLALISTPEAFPALARETRAPNIGDSVMVVGAPLGLDATVTSGIVSALRTQDGHAYLQFSAPISPGNSGGPVVDNRGRVVGIAVSKYVGDNAEGLSFAVPVGKLCSGLNVC